ncbi:hypothetical protein [Nocardioides bruguierae]|uniref:hypothetical protein n=1 Tax=Nocardioides bruguierae TaxID=2945102 RepID=UPI00201FF106|nr:hypothetical protein [Nocardioides bruguierae]MCL8024268.1 hypothetical protein [Nocardioides bruguierae]
MTRRSRTRAPLAVTACLALGLVLGACGSEDTVASDPGAASSSSPGTVDEEPASWPEDASVDLVRADDEAGTAYAEAAPVGGAAWLADEGALVYVGEVGYSGSCAPRATLRADWSLALAPGGDKDTMCTMDAVSWVVVVTGLETPPTQLQVTDLSGTSTVEVVGA